MTPWNLRLHCVPMRQDTDSRKPLDGAKSATHDSRQITVVGQRIDSRQIFIDGREITIVHGQDLYRLRLTAQNKLILTK